MVEVLNYVYSYMAILICHQTLVLILLKKDSNLAFTITHPSAYHYQLPSMMESKNLNFFNVEQLQLLAYRFSQKQ
jgi:hypothetical protein